MIIIIPIGPHHEIRARRIGVWPGTCRVCGCTDERGCWVGCWWVEPSHTLCSRCLHNMALLAFAMTKNQRGTS
jgi:hypothetical protein